jgi:2-methylcitrate dehydratase PrpD
MIEYGVAPLNLNLTTKLCSFLAEIEFTDLPPSVVHAARRGALDWIGCALVGSSHPTVSKLLHVLQASSDTRRVTVLGRGMKLGPLDAALANGLMGHVLDYDDTHMQGVILHTSSPVLAALLALAETYPVSGREFITAYVAGFETGVRVGRAAPGHHRGGWHLTGTLGSIAAAAACGRLLKLSPRQLAHAVGIGATQAAGMQQNRGTMSKSLHAGKAAQNGLLASLLAQQGFDSSLEILEGRKGFCRIYSDVSTPEDLVEGLGKHWEITNNGFKPYACGVVMHPAIDAMIGLRNSSEVDPTMTEKIEEIELVVNPIAVAVTGVNDPQSGLQSKFSLKHSAAVAFLDRTAGVSQYTDERAVSGDVQALRQHLIITTDPGYRTDQASTSMKIGNRTFHSSIDHATGTTDNPMSDAALEQKFLTNAGAALPAGQTLELRDTLWELDTVEDMRTIPVLCSPRGDR